MRISIKRTTIVLLLFFVVAGCSTVPITNRNRLSFISDSQLASLSNNAYIQILEKAKLSDDIGKTKTVARVGSKVARAAEDFLREHQMDAQLKYYNWEFNLIEDEKIANAFCLSGGKIAVYTGLLPITRDENGLAVVLAHEVAHAIANHHGERMSQTTLVELGGSLLQAFVTKESKDNVRYVMMAYGLGANVGVLLPFSRKHESEADHIGLILMARAGYDPRETIPLLERMAADAKRTGGGSPEFISTHPSDNNRIETIRSELPEALSYYRR
ncbi:MAG: M48 family metallopeptidase [Candidatus Omnitrophota bacterium]